MRVAVSPEIEKADELVSLAMKIKGVIRGQTIELESPTGLPDGQPVEVHIEPARSAAKGPERASAQKAEETSAHHTLSPNVQAADDLRHKIALQWGNRADLSVQFIREDRDR